MTIRNFTLGNFKSFANANNLLQNASPINMIYGHNNSGKSNLLKFLNLLLKSKDKFDEVEVEGKIVRRSQVRNFYDGLIENEPFIYHKNNRSVDIKYEIILVVTKLELQTNFTEYAQLAPTYFSNADDTVEIKLSGRIYSIDSQSTSLIELQGALIDNKEAFAIDAGVSIYFRGIEGLEGQSQILDSLLSYFNNAINFIDNNRYFTEEKFAINDEELRPANFKNWLYNKSLNNFKHAEYEEFLGFVRKYKVGKRLVDLEKLDISFAVDIDNNVDIMLNKGEDRLPISSFGTGISQVLFILAKIFDSTARIISIEELELNLSPNTQKELLNIFLALIKDNIIDQVFFTSHSPFFNFRNDFSLYEIEINAAKVSTISKKAAITGNTFWRNNIIG